MAWLFPKLGSSEGPIHWKPWINGGIALVFFFYGVKLNPRQLMEGLSNWKLHLTIQLFTFIVFPFLVLLIFRWLPWVDEDFELGITYLAALPSTVSASVVMVNIAGGNVPAAIFNASISGLLGVVITPAWMGILAENLGQGEVDFWPTFVDLTIKVILPVFAGVLLHGKLFPLIRSHLKRLKYLDQAIIMMIVFTAFSDSFYQKIFQPYSWLSLLKIAFLMLILFLMVLLSIELVSRFLGFSIKDRITALFCGSKKISGTWSGYWKSHVSRSCCFGIGFTAGDALSFPAALDWVIFGGVVWKEKSPIKKPVLPGSKFKYVFRIVFRLAPDTDFQLQFWKVLLGSTMHCTWQLL